MKIPQQKFPIVPEINIDLPHGFLGFLTMSSVVLA